MLEGIRPADAGIGGKPFISPQGGGKLAVKAVDYTGMEHMKVIDTP